MQWRSIWLAAPLFFFAAFGVWAHDQPKEPLPFEALAPGCESYFTPEQHLKMAKVLADVPKLRAYISVMANDRKVSPYLKAFLKRSLLDVNIENH